MAARTQDAPGYYIWEVPGTPVTVHLHLDVLNRMSAEVMRGFGAVPKRGAEVGGILIGTIRSATGDDPALVIIDDFEPVQCEYKRGPSYLFTDEEKVVFEDAVQRSQPGGSKLVYAVGFFRSQTRDGLTLAHEDIELLDEFFPDSEQVALLVKPFGTKVSEAGFFVRENGSFPAKSPLEFPFRRSELTGEAPPPRRSMMERRPRDREVRSMVPRREEPAGYDDSYDAQEQEEADPRHPPGRFESSQLRPALTGPAYATILPSRPRFNTAVWIPLSFVFLLFGVALGFMISFSRVPKSSSGDPQDFALGLSVSKVEDNLSVKWDRQSGAIRAAQSGTLEIEEDGKTNLVSLDTATLQNGTVLVQKPTHSVRFRLTVTPRARLSIVETTEWRP